MSKGIMSSELWLTGGCAAVITQAPTGLHALAIALVAVAYAISRAWIKMGAE